MELELYDVRCERDFVGLCIRDGSYYRTGRAHFTNEQVKDPEGLRNLPLSQLTFKI